MKSTAQSVYCEECVFGVTKGSEWRWCEKPISEFVGGDTGAVLKSDKNYTGQCKDFKPTPDSWLTILKRKWLK
jgi:hypothetical protein